jgi:hypothetical protein
MGPTVGCWLSQPEVLYSGVVVSCLLSAVSARVAVICAHSAPKSVSLSFVFPNCLVNGMLCHGRRHLLLSLDMNGCEDNASL